MMVSKGFRGGIRELVEFESRKAFKDTGGVRAGFDILKEKEVEVKRGGTRIGMGVVKEISKGYVARGST